MKKRVKVDRSRLDRFDFEPVRNIKAAQMEEPEIRESLKNDLIGTLEGRGIIVDNKFREKIRLEWRSIIKSDIRRVADENPESDNWYLKRVIEEKPIKLSVRINKETGEKEKTLRRSQ